MTDESHRTFLFTDLEGSTPLWEQAPDAMPAALALHETILQTAIDTAGGQVFKLVGDAVCAVFPHAQQALSAAVVAQRTLHQTAWTTPTPLRVRIGIHCGPAAQRANDYLGPTLNRVARITAAGHGGDIILSQQVAHRVGAALPAGVHLEDQGLHTLKGFTVPEQLYRVILADVPAVPLPLRTPPAGQSQPLWLVPQPPTSLVSRPEVSAVVAILQAPHGRLVTLTGTGGSGKTRLSLAVATHLQHHFTDGVVFVALAPIQDPTLVLPTIAQTLGLTDTAHASIVQRLVAYLRPRQLLLLIDNMEQVHEAAADLALLLEAAPQLRMLVSSRWSLQIYGEHTVPVPPLGCPPLHPVPPLADLRTYPAIQLFLDRARAVQPTFDLTPATAAAVAAICTRVDGLPLAIELAAAWVRVLSPAAILARLTEHIDLLADRAATRPPRQQSLRTTIDWSYDLLSRAEQDLFLHLGVFTGGWSEPAAASVVGAAWPGPIVDGLAALVTKSLVVPVMLDDGSTRFSLLETLRAYALERLEPSMRQQIQGQHARYYLALVTATAAALAGPDQVLALQRLAADQENVRAALAWTAEADPGRCVQLAVHMAPIWHRLSAWSESIHWLTRAAARRSQVDPALQARLLRETAHVLIHAQGQHATSGDAPLALFAKSLALYRTLDDPAGTATVLMQLGWSRATMQRDYATAERDLAEGLALFQELHDDHGIGWALHNLGDLARDTGDHALALERYTQALPHRERAGDQSGIGWTLLNSGVLLRRQQPAVAQARVEAALDRLQQTGDALGVIIALADLAGVAGDQGNAAAAAVSAARAQIYAHTVRDPAGSARLLQTLGDVLGGHGQHETALQAYQDALERYADLQDRQNQAVTLGAMGTIWWWQRGDAQQSQPLLERALALGDDHPAGVEQAEILTALGTIALAAGDYPTADRHLEAAVVILQATQAWEPLATALLYQGWSAAEQGADECALDCTTRALHVAVQAQARDLEGLIAQQQTFVLGPCDRLAALRTLRDRLAIVQTCQSPRDQATLLLAIAWLAGTAPRSGVGAAAVATLLGAATHCRQQDAMDWWVGERGRIAQLAADVRTQGAGAAWEVAWNAGAAQPLAATWAMAEHVLTTLGGER